MKSKILSALTVLGIAFSFQACAVAEIKSDVNYDLWAKVLKGHVNEQGLVDYKKLKADRADLDQFIKQVESADLETMAPNEKKAFWINAYNALTMRLIVE